MADRLTQLQEAYDQLLLQMFASIKYINTKHPHAPITGYSVQPPTSTSTATTEEPSSTSTSTEERPASPTTFTRTLHELAQDLVVKQAQIEYLIESLPGLGSSQAMQEARIEELERELGVVEGRRREAAREREELLRRVEGRIGVGRRV